MKRLIALAVLALLAALTGGASAQAATAPACQGLPAPVPPVVYKHVVWIIMENRSFNEVAGTGAASAPYLNSLGCGQAANYHNITHPSLPNYIALTSGLPVSQLPTTDCYTVVCSVNAPSIFGQVTTAGLAWGTYAESMPAPCYTKDKRPYVVHHNPPPFYPDAATLCPTANLPLTSMDPNNLPAFSVIVPNVLDNMHQNTSSVAAGDTWLSQHLPPILGSVDYLAGLTAVFITWDEGGFPRHTKNCQTTTVDQGCHVLTEVLAESVPAGTVDSVDLFNHYSLLRTTEELLGLPLLASAGTATSMRTAFGL